MILSATIKSITKVNEKENYEMKVTETIDRKGITFEVGYTGIDIAVEDVAELCEVLAHYLDRSKALNQ